EICRAGGAGYKNARAAIPTATSAVVRRNAEKIPPLIASGGRATSASANAERPRIYEDDHRGRVLSLSEPINDHFGHENVQQNATYPCRDTTEQLELP